MKQEMQRSKRVPIPTNYRNATKYVRLAVEERQNVQLLLERDKHFRCGRTLVGRVLSNWPIIDALYHRLDLATKEPKTNPWLAKVLISEMLYGSGRLVGNAASVLRMQQYEQQLRSALDGLTKNMPAGASVQAPRYVRINTTEIEPEDAKRLLVEEEFVLVKEKFTDYHSFIERVKRLDGLEFMEDFHFPDMLVFAPSAKRLWAKAAHLMSKFVLQDKACLIPTNLLKPAKKSVVLDMCAAPGNKTTHLACLMKNRGRIYAVERNAARYTSLCENVQKFGVIKTIKADCLLLTQDQMPGVEFILVDPSCSGSGMRQRMMVEEPVDHERLRKLAGLQYKLLSHAMNAFPNARRIVYSTCSLYEEENEKVVQSVLRHNNHFRLLDARRELGKEGFSVGSSNYPGVGPLCMYAKTVDDLTIGMFVAVFERCPEGVENEVYLDYEKHKASYGRLARKEFHNGEENENIGNALKRKMPPQEQEDEPDLEVEDEEELNNDLLDEDAVDEDVVDEDAVDEEKVKKNGVGSGVLKKKKPVHQTLVEDDEDNRDVQAKPLVKLDKTVKKRKVQEKPALPGKKIKNKKS